MLTDKIPGTRWLSFVERKKEKITLKITNYPCLAVCRSLPELQRTPLVLTLTKTTHVTQSTSTPPSKFFSVPLDFKVPSDVVYTYLLFPSASVSPFSYLLVCQIKGKRGYAKALIDGKRET